MRIFLTSFLLLISVAVYCQASLEEGLVLHYTFSGKAEDISGNRNNPKSDNTKRTDDRFGKPESAARFNGKSSYIRVPDAQSLHMNDKISLCVWIRPNGFYSGRCHGNSVIMKGKQHGETNYLLRFDESMFSKGAHCNTRKVDEAHQNFYGAAMGGESYEPYVISGKWQSVVYTYDGTTARLYIGCVEVKKQEVPDLYFTNPHDLLLGKIDFPGYEYWLNADLDDVRIYNRAISPEEVNLIAECKVDTESPTK